MSVKPVKPKIFHGDVRQLPQVKEKIKKAKPEPKEPSAELPATVQPDSALQQFAPAAPAPTPSASFAGLDFANWGDGWPPDTNGDVGPNHYIETVNTSIGIYNKSTGVRLAAFSFNTLFSQAATGTPCDNSNQGDPVALYDALSDRWIVSDFAWSNYTSGAMYQCMAVSQTSDPVAGGWYFYAWQTATGGKIPDYPKLGVWPDGIYMSANVFGTTGSQAFQNAQVWAFNRTEMESGVTAHVVSFSLPQKIGATSLFGLLPSNLRTNGSAPAAGTPNYFTSIYGIFAARVWKFHVDYGVPANSTLTGPSNVTISSFSAGPGSVPEKTGNNVDTLSYRLMMQNQYQNANGVESLWITHTIGNGGSPNVAQLRWYQLNVTGGTVITAGPIQQGTWAPDSKNRFMPSLALDKNGDMALGYSVSDSTMFPAIRYAGRLANDALGTLGQGETSLLDGTGYQCCNFSDGSTNTRWGDYSTMTIDPDGCTFWYTNDYYDTAPATLAQDNWKTRIGSFKYPGCTPNPLGILQGTVTDAGTSNPISGALVTAGIHILKTNASGFYNFGNTPAGTYTVNVTASGYNSGSANNVNVSNGGTTTQNFALSTPLTSTSISVGAASGTYGGTTTLTATLTQQGGPPLSGKTITFTLNGASFAGNTAVTNGSGVATLANVSLAGINAATYPTGVGASFAAGGGFAGSSGANSLTISKATPVITWSNPANITYGTALSATELNASPSVPGSFVYNPVGGTVLHFGNSQSLSTTFTPTDTTNYNGALKSVNINVQKAVLTATAQDKSKTYRATNPTLTYALTGFVNSDTQGSATTGQPTLSTTAVTTSVVGGYPITIVAGTLSATDYTFSFVNGTLTVSKATPVITWSNPADIVYGTLLGSTQLNATASNPNDSSSVAGSFNYNPASGTLLNAGNNQSLSTTFTQTDTTNYNGTSGGASINVLKANQTISFGSLPNKTYGDPDFTVSATASSGLGVSFGASGQCTIGGNLVHLTAPGSCTITASQAGNSNYNAAPNAPQSFTIAAQSSNSATFVNLDTVTQGNWKGVYGAEGYNVINDTVSYPAYAQVSPSGQNSYTWAASTSDVRALQKALISDRIAGTWYTSTTFDIDINLTDGQTHQLSLYCLDWDPASRVETIDVLDATSNALLDTRNVSSFGNGQYVVWNLSGHVKLRVTNTAGVNAVVSGLFFQSAAAPPPTPTPTPTPIAGSASFVNLDPNTQGNWKGVYGADGYNVINDTVNYPAYAQVTPVNQSSYTWASSTTDVRALQKALISDRIAGTWYTSTSFDIDINLTDGQAHQLSLYCLDWDPASRVQTIDVLDATSNAVLDSRSVSSFGNGQYLVWKLSGHVRLRVTNTAGVNAVVSGLFFQ